MPCENEESDNLSHYEFSFDCRNAPHDPICDKSGSAYTDYVYLNGRLKLKMTGTNSYWYVDDALGSTRLVYKASTKVFSVTTYKPFGIAFGASGTEKFTYAGEMQDSPSGLFYLFARHYDPSTGRFVSMDPKLGKLSMPQTLNRYAYCANNPINRVDPTGEFFNLIAAAIGAAVGAIGYSIYTVATGGTWDAGQCLIAVGAGALAGLTLGASLTVLTPALTTVAASTGLGATGSAIVGTIAANAIGGALAGAVGAQFSYRANVAYDVIKGKGFHYSPVEEIKETAFGAFTGLIIGGTIGTAFRGAAGKYLSDLESGIINGVWSGGTGIVNNIVKRYLNNIFSGDSNDEDHISSYRHNHGQFRQIDNCISISNFE